MPRVMVVLPQARTDLDILGLYYFAKGGHAFADRFADAFAESARSLLEFPHKGAVQELRSPRLRDVRRVPIAGFDRVLVFYRVTPASIDVARVLHAIRDLKREDSA